MQPETQKGIKHDQPQQTSREPKKFFLAFDDKKLMPNKAIEQPNGNYILEHTYSSFEEAENVQIAFETKFGHKGYTATIESKSTDESNPFADEIHSVRINANPVIQIQAEQPVDKAETPQEEEQEDQEFIDQEALIFELDETIRANLEIMNILTEYIDTVGNIDWVKMDNLSKVGFSRFSFFPFSFTKLDYNKLTFILKDDSKKDTFRNTIRQVVAIRTRLKGTSYLEELYTFKAELEERLQ